MKRTNIHLTDDQLTRLRACSKASGLSVAELVRRMVDKYLAGAYSGYKKRST